MSTYLVGIDLGTTHTVAAYARRHARGLSGPPGATKLLQIPQLVAHGQWALQPLLPSVRYHAAVGELAAADLQLPWPQPELAPADQPPVVLGQWARQLGAQVPGRLVASAKSWLSHAGVDRQAAILPWGSAPEVLKVSPVEASASLLRHVVAAWHHHMPEHPLAQQDIVLTVPASFDEAARALTLSAAHLAGLPQLRLLEEPQAVFYDWLWRHRTRLTDALAGVQRVLVCDVGGGTTDLSLIDVALHAGEPQLTRIGVGHHLMLGGDNMDLALAHTLEARLAGDLGATPAQATAATPRLSASQLAQLMARCRLAKEQLLSAQAPDALPITLLGGGARLIGGSRSTVLTRQEVQALVVEGFFPQVDVDARAQVARKGLVEFGLPYARDPAVTRHIADFVRQHGLPDTLLLNGGVFRAEALVRRVHDTLAQWRAGPVTLLHNDNPDVSVARGAVAYALAPKIGGGSARSYFLQLDNPTRKTKVADVQPAATSMNGLCILPRGADAGVEVVLAERSFALRLGQPVRFWLFSTVDDGPDRRPYALGQAVDLALPGFEPLPPIATVMEATSEHSKSATGIKDAQSLPVQLVTCLTEVGTLEMHCVSLTDPTARWRLEFDLRHHASASGTEPATNTAKPAAAARLDEARQHIARVFGPGGHALAEKDIKPLRQQLERALGERSQWATPELRALFDSLWQHARARRRSPAHERVWLNLAGYCLRPGFGDALDAWRLQQLWAQFDAGVQHSRDKQVCTEWWTLWRRVAPGLAAPEQQRLLDDFGYNLHSNERGPLSGAAPPVKGSDDDMLRLGAALERIAVDYKVEIGEWLLERLQKSHGNSVPLSPTLLASQNLLLWTLARIGTREPLCGNSHTVVGIEVASGWVNTLLALDWKRLEGAAFACVQLARVTDDRARDLPSALREQIATRLQATKAPALWHDMLRQRVVLDAATEQRLYGDTLPAGLTLMS